VENSTRGGASTVFIDITEDIENNCLKIQIRDNGRGIKKELLEKITDPFVTTRQERRIGLGISLLQSAALRCNGQFGIDSSEEEGTSVFADFQYDHIDRAPLGDMAMTLIMLLSGNPDVNFEYRHTIGKEVFYFSTREIRDELEGIELNHPDVLNHLKNGIRQGLEEIKKMN
jgi:hypothetical protein